MAERSHTLPIEVTGRTAEVAQAVAKLAREILGNKVEVWWFGSWPGGRAQPHSDLDIAVSTGRPIPPDQLAALREAVEELPTLYEVDLVDLSAVGARLKEEVLRTGSDCDGPTGELADGGSPAPRCAGGSRDGHQSRRRDPALRVLF